LNGIWREQNYFLSLGFTKDVADQLEDALLKIAKFEEVTQEITTDYGTKFIVDGDLLTLKGKNARIRTVWVVDSHDKVPRFVTAYPA